jgi:uroporphyrinogen-III decarboxylase
MAERSRGFELDFHAPHAREALLGQKAIVGRILAGQSASRAAVGPLAVHYCAKLAGISLRDYTLKPRCLAESVVRYYDRFRPDAVWLSADTWVTAEAMGAKVAFPGPQQPLAGTGEPCVSTVADIDRIPPPNTASQGRWPLMLDALCYIKEAIGNDAFVVACFDQYPFSLACALMGIERDVAGAACKVPRLDRDPQRASGLFLR